MATQFLCLSSNLSLAMAPALTTRVPLSKSSDIQKKGSLANSKRWRSICRVSMQGAQTTKDNRRSANYHPNLWNFEFLDSLGNGLEVDEAVGKRIRELEKEVRDLINDDNEHHMMEPLRLLDFIDNVQRMGLTYKFEKDIRRALERIVILLGKNKTEKTGLHCTALTFRLLRQHGFEVSQDVFENFKDREGNFKAEIQSDVKGLLSLYEASYLGFEGENLLDEAREFSTTHLKNNLKKLGTATQLAEHVTRALELPFHRRFHRLEARWFIDKFEEKEPHDRLLLNLAKLDFNLVQALMQKELQELLRWWREIGLASKLDFVRDRLMEVYFWAVGVAPDPQFSDSRKSVTKMFGLVAIIDDVFDIYGTLDELQLFTDAVDRWDVNAMDELPDYMKLCFLALYNTVHDTAYGILKDKGVDSVPCLANSWSSLCKAFLQEAKWCNKKIIPAFNEYLQNASISSSGAALLTSCYFSLSQHITNQALDSLSNHHGVVRSSCTIFRLCNDLATSTDELERGETTNSITSYIHENGTSEEQARLNLRNLIDIEWKKMNQKRFFNNNSTFPQDFLETAMNLARVSECTYQYGDGLGRPDDAAQHRIKLLLIEPIPIDVLTK